ncbi:MAG: hypothetical protein ABW224_02440 [Kibdelosporangium sp.]
MSTDLPAPPHAAEQQQAPKKKGLPKWLTAIIAVVVVAGGVYAFNYFTNDAAQAKAGDCAKVSGTTNAPVYASADCGAADANVTVGKALSNTSESCGGEYLEYTMKASKGPDAKLCLVPKLEEGQCYKFGEGESVDIAKQACGPETIKIAKVVKGAEDKGQCAEGAQAATFPEPKITFCLEPGAA